MRDFLDRVTDVLAEIIFDVGVIEISIGVVGLIMTAYGIKMPMSLCYPFAICIVTMFIVSILHGVLDYIWFKMTYDN